MTKDQFLLDAVADQRNQALNNAANLHAELRVAQIRIAEHEARVKELEEEVAKLKEPKE